VVFEDRRTGLRTRSVGADHVVNQMQSIWADIQRWDRELIATRGPRLALSRNLYVSGEGFEVELLSVLGYDGAGRQSSITAFEANDVDDAFAELDRLYTSLNGSGSTAAWQNLLRWRDARSRGDWDAFERQLTDDCVYVDHRPSLTQELVGREAVMAVARNPLSADSQQRMIAIHAIDDELILVESIAHGTNSEGGAVEVAYMNIFGFRDGNVRRVERYAPEDLEQALLRFHELSPDHGEAARLRRRVTDAVNDRDWDSFIACFSPRMVFKDHRPVGFGESIGAPRAWGPGIVELIPDARIETAAIFHMDDRGGVGQMVIRGHDTHGNPVEHTWVDVTVVHDGVVTRHEHFPPERVDDALARYRELTDGI
jgi:ketosteroid isomerase-like protein